MSQAELEETASSLQATHRQLEVSQAARQESLSSERRWRSQFLEAQEQGAKLKEAAEAATSASDAAAVSLGQAGATLATLNASLLAAEARAAEAVAAAQGSEAARRQLAIEEAEHAKRALDRQAALDQAVATAARCEARVAEEFQAQAACRRAQEERAAFEASLDAQRTLTERAENATDAARQLAAGKEASDVAAAQCAEARQAASTSLATLTAKDAALEKEVDFMRKAEEAALTAQGVAEAKSKASSAAASACAHEGQRTAARLAKLEAELSSVTEHNASCASELLKYVIYVDGAPVGVGPLTRIFRTVRQLLGADLIVAKHHLRGMGGAVRDAVSEVVAAKWWRLDLQTIARARVLGSSLGAWPAASPPPVDLPLDARLFVYSAIVLVLLLLRAWYVQRQLRRTHAALAAELATLREFASTVKGATDFMPVDTGKAEPNSSAANGNGAKGSKA